MAAELRGRRYRLTPQRQLVLAAVAQSHQSTPEQILAVVRRTAASVNISTIYRTLDLLEKVGLVRHSHLGHGAPSFSLAEAEEHVHLVCRRCGPVQELPVASVGDLAARLGAQHGFTVDIGHAAMFGRCARCSPAAP
jgi:Fur family transcriptional regulator, ferric uptake regulator